MCVPVVWQTSSCHQSHQLNPLCIFLFRTDIYNRVSACLCLIVCRHRRSVYARVFVSTYLTCYLKSYGDREAEKVGETTEGRRDDGTAVERRRGNRRRASRRCSLEYLLHWNWNVRASVTVIVWVSVCKGVCVCALPLCAGWLAQVECHCPPQGRAKPAFPLATLCVCVCVDVGWTMSLVFQWKITGTLLLKDHTRVFFACLSSFAANPM